MAAFVVVRPQRRGDGGQPAPAFRDDDRRGSGRRDRIRRAARMGALGDVFALVVGRVHDARMDSSRAIEEYPIYSVA
jgi:hypothetical protein